MVTLEMVCCLVVNIEMLAFLVLLKDFICVYIHFSIDSLSINNIAFGCWEIENLLVFYLGFI